MGGRGYTAPWHLNQIISLTVGQVRLGKSWAEGIRIEVFTLNAILKHAVERRAAEKPHSGFPTALRNPADYMGFLVVVKFEFLLDHYPTYFIHRKHGDGLN